MKNPFMSLSDRIVRMRTVEQETEVFNAAWELIVPTIPERVLADCTARFEQLVEAKAFESAAMLFIPPQYLIDHFGEEDAPQKDGCPWWVSLRLRFDERMKLRHLPSTTSVFDCASAGLALLAAALLARSDLISYPAPKEPAK